MKAWVLRWLSHLSPCPQTKIEQQRAMLADPKIQIPWRVTVGLWCARKLNPRGLRIGARP